MKKAALVVLWMLSGSVILAEDVVFPKIEGWIVKTDKKIYSSGDLWELIDGAAELFLAYGFQDLHLATYTSGKDVEVQAEIYQHSPAVNAYGIYTAERMPDYSFNKIGIQGYTSPGILHFFTGNYYVKLISAGTKEADEASLKFLAGRIAENLGQTNTWPEEIALFPAEGKVYMSDAYIASNFMGYSFFHSAFTARYIVNGEFTLFLIHDTSAEADTILTRYLGVIKEDKVERQGEIYIIQDLFNGKVYIAKKGGYLAGVLNARDEAVAQENLGKILSAIQ